MAHPRLVWTRRCLTTPAPESVSDELAVEGAVPRIARVGEVVARIGELLQNEFPPLWIAGEISNCHHAASGHVYFTLKDHEGQLRCALFRRDATRVAFELCDGLDVIVFGSLSVYGVRGDLQCIVRQLEPRGRGALQLAFEQLRARLEGEGLFREERKRPLPAFPQTVGLVTSSGGAALHDVLRVLRNRAPVSRVLLSSARVQGPAAEGELVAALQALAAHGECDVIALVRGGGSLEDLWPFNSEVLARAIARSPVPVVSGVGHETDITIADLVADLRAPTPTAAAAALLPERAVVAGEIYGMLQRAERAVRAVLATRQEELAQRRRALRALSPRDRLVGQRERLGALALRLALAARHTLGRVKTRARYAAGGLAAASPRRDLERAALRTRGAERDLGAAIRALLRARRERLARAVGDLDHLSPLAVLGRGYAIARHRDDGRIVRAPADVRRGDTLRIHLAEGEIEADVVDREESRLS